jgi:hypothetical protein
MNAKQRRARAQQMRDQRAQNTFDAYTRDANARATHREQFEHASRVDRVVRDTCARMSITRDELHVTSLIACYSYPKRIDDCTVCSSCVAMFYRCVRVYNATLRETRSHAFAYDDAHNVAYACGYNHSHANEFARDARAYAMNERARVRLLQF